MAVRTCDLDTAASLVIRQAGPSASIAIAGDDFARTALLSDVLGLRLPRATFLDASAYFSDDGGVGVRIWMDDPGGFDAYFRAREAAGDPVVGTWVADPPADEHERSAHKEQAEERARERADVVFAALDGFDSVVRLRFMWEHCCDFALWDDHNGFIGDLEELLPIPAELAGRIRGWAVEAQSPHAPPGLDVVGRALADELQAALGPGYRIDYRG